MTFHVITLFPKSFDSYLSASILGRAIKSGLIKVKFYDIKSFTASKRQRVDNKPFGGGPGMVIEALPVVKAAKEAVGKKKNTDIIWLSPSGSLFSTEMAKKISRKENVVIICGRYEGIDERARRILKARKVSIGNYVLSGGELPAMCIIDTVSRQLAGVLGKIESLEESRISSDEVYTRPRKITFQGRNYNVPGVLLTGHKARIDKWRAEKRKSNKIK